MQELADKVWSNPRFHAVASRLQQAWIAHEVNAAFDGAPGLEDVSKAIRASAILACSVRPEHRDKAYRVATSAFELYGAEQLPLDQAVRVVLARLGNFPALQTRQQIAAAGGDLPISLAAEELAVSERRTVQLDDRVVTLTDFQHRLWTKLKAKRRLAVTAPTSAGKSFILQNFLASLFDTPEPQSVVYLVPTRALIAQVSQDLRAILNRPRRGQFHPVDIATVPIEAGVTLPRRAVYVMTQERLQLTLNAHPLFSADVIIVDEAHSIADGSRGVLLQWVIEDLIKRQPDAQLLFASPGVRNLDVFGRVLGLTDVERLPSHEPTVAQNFLWVQVKEPKDGRMALHVVERNTARVLVAEFDLERRTVTRIEKLVNVAERLGRGASNIVYANGAGDAESIALELAARFQTREPTTRQLALAALISEAVHNSYALVECVRRGIAFHYSNMPTQVRQAVEKAVIEGDIDYLVCTSTLLSGVNLPAKNVFMFRPEKGQGSALEAVDFWNLAGRAGRLLKEFQGNIFLIDYPDWKKKPLNDEREVDIVPAIESGVLLHRRELLGIIERANGRDNDLEAVFVRLLDDLAQGSLPTVLGRLCEEHGVAPAQLEPLTQALEQAASRITLPADVLRRSANISAHKQEQLYAILRRRAKTSRGAARALLPKHPRDDGAYDSYADILRLCHRVILGRPKENRYHRFIALIALWWMSGYPLPRIIQKRINREPTKDKRLIVRETLELVERDVRYQCVRLFGCYTSILMQVLEDLDMQDVLANMPAVPLFLEVGASDRTMISLMAIGLNRTIALKLATIAPGRNMQVPAILEWLRSANLEKAQLSLLMREELSAILAGTGNVIPLR